MSQLSVIQNLDEMIKWVPSSKLKGKNLINSKELLKQIRSEEKYNRVGRVGNGLLCCISILWRFLKT
jgi:hypothetical protein